MKSQAIAEVYTVTLSSGSYSKPYKENKLKLFVDINGIPAETKLYSAEVVLKAEARIEELELLLGQARGMVNGATDEWHNKVAEVLEGKQ